MTEPTFDLSSLLGAATEMQATLAAAQDQVAEQHFVGSAGGRAVTITLSGAYEAIEAHIAESALGEGPELLADLVLAALRDALNQVGAAHQGLAAAFDPSALLGAFAADPAATGDVAELGQ